MSVSIAAIKAYLNPLDNFQQINLDDSSITVEDKKQGRRTKKGQTTAALGHVKQVIAELINSDCDRQERAILKSLFAALNEIPDAFSLTKFLSLAKHFNQVQQNIISKARAWITLNECTSSDVELLKHAMLAIGMLLKCLEYDFSKDPNQPFKKGVTLLTAEQKQAQLKAVQDLMRLLSDKPLKIKAKLNRESFLADYSDTIDAFDGSNFKTGMQIAINLKKLHLELSHEKSLYQQQQHLLHQQANQTIDAILGYQKLLASKGLTGFWQSFSDEKAFTEFVNQFVSENQRAAWRYCYQKRNTKHTIYQDESLVNVTGDNRGLWHGVCRFFGLMVYRLKANSYYLLRGQKITVDLLDEAFNSYLESLFERHIDKALPKTTEDKLRVISSHYPQRISELEAYLDTTEALQQRLQAKMAAHYLTTFINQTSWWLWLISSEYRHACRLVTKTLQASIDKASLDLSYRILTVASHSHTLWGAAKTRLNHLTASRLYFFSEKPQTIQSQREMAAVLYSL